MHNYFNRDDAIGSPKLQKSRSRILLICQIVTLLAAEPVMAQDWGGIAGAAIGTMMYHAMRNGGGGGYYHSRGRYHAHHAGRAPVHTRTVTRVVYRPVRTAYHPARHGGAGHSSGGGGGGGGGMGAGGY